MPDIPNRDELERRLARMLGKLNRAHLGRLIELLGDPPLIENVPESFWLEAGEEMGAALTPFAESVYLASAARLLNESPIGVDWNLINEQAAAWADNYAFDLISGINRTSRDAVSRAISGYFREGQTIGQLTDRLSNIYSPIRAEMIAVTEVTRASVQGELAIAKELEAQGVRMIAEFQTNKDERVCPICMPLDGKVVTENEHPPRHPRCRCWINHTFEKVPA